MYQLLSYVSIVSSSRKQIPLWICLSLLSICANSQNFPTIDAITLADGLGFRDVRSIGQDNQGLIWIGTQQGLNRFDGYHFTYFNKGPTGDYALPAEDFAKEGLIVKDSLLWYIANERLFTLNLRTHKVQAIPVTANPKNGIPLNILQIHLGKKGNIWLAAENKKQQFLLRLSEDQPATVIAQHPRMIREFTHLATDTSGNIYWTTIANGLEQFTPDGQLLQTSRADTFIWYDYPMYFTPFFIDSQNRLFVFPKSRHEIWIYNLATEQKTVIQQSLDSPVYRALEDHRGHVWFATKQKLLELDTAGQWYDYSELINKSFDFTTIHCLFEDRMQLLWVGTDNGILKLPIKKQAFTNFLHIKGAEWGNTTRGFFENGKGEVFFMCERGEQGLHKIDWEKNLAIPQLTLENKTTADFPLDLANFFQYDPCRRWVWTANNQLNYLTETPRLVTPIPSSGGFLSGFKFNPILLLDDGQLLLGKTMAELSVYRPDTDSYQRLIPSSSPLSTDDPTKFFLQVGDTLWIGTSNLGLLKMSREGQLLQQYTTETTPAISHNHILCLEQDEEGILWIGTFGGGLNRLDPRQGTIRVYTQKDNLANNNVVGILAYDQNYLWISTYHGLSCFNKANATFQNFYQEDGLSHNEFNYASYFKDSKGRYYFGGMNGVTAFYPEDIIGQAPNPPLQLTSWSRFSQKDKQLAFEDLRYFEGETLVIKPDISYFQINWTLPNYFKPDKNQYYTKLQDLEDDWTYIGNQPSIRYNKLPVGDYVLHIKGADSRGNWSSSQLSIPIHVEPFFFKTWWFITLCILFVSLVISSFFYYRWQQLLKMERMRLKISSNLHDEVGSMLSGLAMQAEIMEMKAPPADQAGLSRLSEISRQAVSKMRDLVWSIDTRRDRVKDLVERMQEHAEEMLIPKEISFTFDIGYLPVEKRLLIDIRQHLQLIFREAVTNIVTHTDATQVYIQLHQDAGFFHMLIKDNGTNAPEKWQRPSTGLGIENIKMRARQLGGELKVEATSAGTVLDVKTKPL